MSEKEIKAQFYTTDQEGNSTCIIDNAEVKNIETNENGTVQVTFNVVETNKNNQTLTVTYNPNDKSSMENVLTMIVGSGGYQDVGTDLDGNALNQGLDHITVTYGDAYSENGNTNQAVVDILGTIADKYDVNYENIVTAGASAGAKNTPALSVLCQDLTDNPVNIMLIDAEGDAGPFFDSLRKHPDLLAAIVEDGGTIYAYEADKFRKDGGSNVNGAKTNLAKVADLGANVILVENKNGNFHMAPYGISVKGGEVYNIFNDFNQELIVRITSNTEDYTSNKCFENYNQFVDDNVYEYYYNGEWHKTSTQAINKYQNSLYKDVRSEYYGLSQLSDISVTNNNVKNLSYSPDAPISIEFKSGVNGTNGIINAIRKTSFINDGVGYQLCESTTSFPDSLNNSNAFLFGITGNLLGNLASETASIENILRNYSYMDMDLARQAEELGNGFDQLIATNLSFTKTPVVEMDPKYLELFPTNIPVGHAGKINVSDLERMLGDDGVTGIIGQGLQGEISDAENLKATIELLINDPTINGPGWGKVQEHLREYEGYCDLRIQAANILAEAYENSLTLVKEYMYPDTELDDSKLHSLYEKIDAIELKITKLSALVNKCVEVTHTIYRANGKKSYYTEKTYPYKHYAKNIAAYEEQLEELNKSVQKLEGLPKVINNANKIIQDAIIEVNLLYNAPVSQIKPMQVEPLYKTTEI